MGTAAHSVDGGGSRPTLPAATGLSRARALTALFVVAAVLVGLAVRLPNALHDLSRTAASQVGRNQAGGALAAADGFGVNDEFVLAALQVVPARARYALLFPADAAVASSTYGVAALTLEALPLLLREVLLPRLDTVPADAAVPGTYIVCYLCDTAPWDHRTRWLWHGSTGAIGRLYR